MIFDCPPPTHKAQEAYLQIHLGLIVGQRRESLLVQDAVRLPEEDDRGFGRLARLELGRRASLEA